MRTPARWRGSWIAVAIALSACGGGGEKPAPTPQKFTAEMVQGKTFCQEAVIAPDQQKMLITFSSATDVSMWEEQAGGVGEVTATWSIDADGKLVLQAGVDHITVTLYTDAATYLDVVADDGTGPTSARLYKTIPFGGAHQDRFAVADRDLAGTTQTVGVAAFGSGTGVFTDGFSDDSVTWVEAADGSVTLSSAAEDNVLHLRADSVTTSPKSLRVVGRRHDAGTATFTGIVDTVLTETPAKSGFTADMVADKVFYRDNTPVNRSIVRYLAGDATGGAREEWYEDTSSVEYRLGTWTLTPLSGSLVALPAEGIPEVAAMLVEDGPTRWDLLVNTGAGIFPASLEKTVAVTAGQWFTYTWSVVHFGVTGNTVGPYPIVIGDGTGTDPYGQPFTWVVQGDGSIRVTWPNTDTLTVYQRATSAPPSLFETAGIWTSGPITELRIQRYRR